MLVGVLALQFAAAVPHHADAHRDGSDAAHAAHATDCDLAASALSTQGAPAGSDQSQSREAPLCCSGASCFIDVTSNGVLAEARDLAVVHTVDAAGILRPIDLAPIRRPPRAL